jgi:branched-chain amino acid transport system ATP-binding protein
LLEVRDLSGHYGPIQALRGVSLDVGPGEAVAVLGPNGAGKSTLLRAISGLVKSKGSIRYQEHELVGRPPEWIVRQGVVQVPEGRRIFTQMTVLDNLLLGAYTCDDGAAQRDHLDFVYGLFPDLAEKRHQLGGELSGGQQQMLAIGRGLMARPSLLLLDEPSLGLSPIMVEQVGATIAAIRKDLGTSILIVEQNAALALEMAARAYVMQSGRVVMSFDTNNVSTEEIREAYLGRRPPEAHLERSASPG